MSLFLGQILSIIIGLSSFSCESENQSKPEKVEQIQEEQKQIMEDKRELATLGAGCFWCIEAVFQQLEGVDTVISGYTGGEVKNPSYKEVCTGRTGHAEVAQISFNPDIISFKEILKVFFATHDPTTLNRQGNDFGTQYRSSIFYHTSSQKKTAEEVIKALNESNAYENPIVTDVSEIGDFYLAEDYHQNYFRQNGDMPYCQFVIQPKLEKFEKAFKDKLKK